MSNVIGFYGGGNMGVAIIKGVIDAKMTAPKDILVYDLDVNTQNRLHKELGVSVDKSQAEIAKMANMIILAVKPGIVPIVLKAIKDDITPDTIVVSIAAGVTLAALEENLPVNSKVVRVMPNTPALIGEGMSALTPNTNLSDDEKEYVLNVFSSFGKAEFVGEYLMDAVVGVSGSAPAYVYMFIEAMADGAVLCGMPRPQAYQFAAQTVLGSAKMVLETGQHPGALKDMVCSPGGTTIAAVKALEENNFRNTVMSAVKAASDKNCAMAKKD